MGFILADHPIDKDPSLPSAYIYNLMRAISPNRTPTVVMLRVHLNEDRDQDGLGVFAVAGYLGLPGDWDAFQQEWARILKVFNRRHRLSLRHFHIPDLVAGREDFKKVGVSERAELLSELCKLGKRRAGFGVGGFVIGKDYREIIGPPEQRPVGQPSPFTLCTEAAIVMAKSLSLEESRIKPIVHIIEKRSRYADELRDGFKRAQQDSKMRELMAGDCFFEAPEETAGLQLAGFYAWTLAAKHDKHNNKIPAAFEQVIDGFLYTHRHAYWQYDFSGLGAGRNVVLSLRQARLRGAFLQRSPLC